MIETQMYLTFSQVTAVQIPFVSVLSTEGFLCLKMHFLLTVIKSLVMKSYWVCKALPI